MMWERLFTLWKYNFVSTKLSLGISARNYAYLEQQKKNVQPSMFCLGRLEIYDDEATFFRDISRRSG